MHRLPDALTSLHFISFYFQTIHCVEKCYLQGCSDTSLECFWNIYFLNFYLIQGSLNSNKCSRLDYKASKQRRSTQVLVIRRGMRRRRWQDESGSGSNAQITSINRRTMTSIDAIINRQDRERNSPLRYKYVKVNPTLRWRITSMEATGKALRWERSKSKIKLVALSFCFFHLSKMRNKWSYNLRDKRHSKKDYMDFFCIRYVMLCYLYGKKQFIFTFRGMRSGADGVDKHKVSSYYLFCCIWGKKYEKKYWISIKNLLHRAASDRITKSVVSVIA